MSTATLTRPDRNITTLDDIVAEKCDRCGFRAYLVAFNGEGLPLAFCGHHGKRAMPGLQALGWEVLDFTDHIA